MKKKYLLTGNGTNYQTYSTTGRVAQASTYATTQVHGGGGGGFAYQGAGATAPVTITSTTTVHDTIFLIDDEGREHSFQLANLNVACRPGNELTVIMAEKQRNKKCLYLAVYNHSTDQVFMTGKAAIVDMFFYPWRFHFIAMAIALAVFILQPILAGLICFALIIYTVVNIVKANGEARKFLSNFNAASYK